ncbi:MAG: hypothetical protein EBY28_21850 [Betaproteobacteria bacterium]|nr:hypothetical protein [Betaproteobacteria bacterium]
MRLVRICNNHLPKLDLRVGWQRRRRCLSRLEPPVIMQGWFLRALFSIKQSLVAILYNIPVQ